jgi:hypothetical protein
MRAVFSAIREGPENFSTEREFCTRNVGQVMRVIDYVECRGTLCPEHVLFSSTKEFFQWRQ